MLTQDQLAAQLRKDLTPEEREKALQRGRNHYVSAGARPPQFHFCTICGAHHRPGRCVALEH